MLPIGRFGWLSLPQTAIQVTMLFSVEGALYTACPESDIFDYLMASFAAMRKRPERDCWRRL